MTRGCEINNGITMTSCLIPVVNGHERAACLPAHSHVSSRALSPVIITVVIKVIEELASKLATARSTGEGGEDNEMPDSVTLETVRDTLEAALDEEVRIAEGDEVNTRHHSWHVSRIEQRIVSALVLPAIL